MFFFKHGRCMACHLGIARSCWSDASPKYQGAWQMLVKGILNDGNVYHVRCPRNSLARGLMLMINAVGNFAPGPLDIITDCWDALGGSASSTAHFCCIGWVWIDCQASFRGIGKVPYLFHHAFILELTLNPGSHLKVSRCVDLRNIRSAFVFASSLFFGSG